MADMLARMESRFEATLNEQQKLINELPQKRQEHESKKQKKG